MASELSKETVMAWRAFAQTKAFADGIQHLQEERKISVKGKDATALIQEGLTWGSYMEALQDLTDVLSNIPKAEKSAEDSGLES